MSILLQGVYAFRRITISDPMALMGQSDQTASRTELTIAYIFYGSKAVIGIPKIEHRNVFWKK